MGDQTPSRWIRIIIIRDNCWGNVPADGNCLFHAISDQLKRLKLHRYRHGELREMAINQLRSQPIIVCSDCVQTNENIILYNVIG